MYQGRGPTEKYFAKLGRFLDMAFEKIEGWPRAIYYHLYSKTATYNKAKLWLMIFQTTFTVAIFVADTIVIIQGGPWLVFLGLIVLQFFVGTPYIVALARKVLNLMAKIKGVTK
jgi:hypothetical protein